MINASVMRTRLINKHLTVFLKLVSVTHFNDALIIIKQLQKIIEEHMTDSCPNLFHKDQH